MSTSERPEHSPQVSLPPSPYGVGTQGHEGNTREEKDTNRRPSAVRFRDLPAPVERPYVVEELVPQGYVTMLYADGGSGKSLLALSLGIAVAGGAEEWLGRRVQHDPVLYLDFELDAYEQQRRAFQLARGVGLDYPPDDLYYMPALGFSPGEAFGAALEECKRRKIKLLILDSVGLALQGDAEAARDVIGFYKRDIEPLRAEGVTPLIIDHQSRLQPGQRYENKRAFGSVFKGNLARSVLQAGPGQHEEGTLTVTLRHVKHNFGALAGPTAAKLTFTEGSLPWSR